MALSVFPVPVGAISRIWSPESPRGIACFCTSERTEKPLFRIHSCILGSSSRGIMLLHRRKRADVCPVRQKYLAGGLIHTPRQRGDRRCNDLLDIEPRQFVKSRYEQDPALPHRVRFGKVPPSQGTGIRAAGRFRLTPSHRRPDIPAMRRDSSSGTVAPEKVRSWSDRLDILMLPGNKTFVPQHRKKVCRGTKRTPYFVLQADEGVMVSGNEEVPRKRRVRIHVAVKVSASIHQCPVSG